MMRAAFCIPFLAAACPRATTEPRSDDRRRRRFGYLGAATGARLARRAAIGADGRHTSEARRVTFPHPWPDALLPLAAARQGACPQDRESTPP